MTKPQKSNQKTLALKDTWFLWLAAAAVVLMFAFVIVPYIDPQPAQLSGQKAQDFNLELLNAETPGERVKLSDLKGKTVILDFWASWCAPCREQSAQLVRASADFGEDVYVLGVATSDELEKVLEKLTKEPTPYPHVFDEAGQLSKAYRVTNLPTVVMINKVGEVRLHQSRIIPSQELLSLAASLDTLSP